MPVDARSCATNSNAKGAVGSLRNVGRLFRLDKTSRRRDEQKFRAVREAFKSYLFSRRKMFSE